MGGSGRDAPRVHFDARVRLEFRGATITSDAGLLACRDLDEALGLTETSTSYLQESRGGRNAQHELAPPLRQSVYGRLAGHEDTNDAARLARDPAMRVVASRRASEKQAAPINTLSRFKTEVLTRDENLDRLGRLNAKRVDRARVRAALGAALVPPLCGQPGTPPPVHPGLQPGQLLAAVSPAGVGEGLVVAQPPGQAGQDSHRSAEQRALSPGWGYNLHD